MRLDLYLVQKTKLARHQIQKMIEEGGVKVAGRVILKPAFKVQGDETIEYQLPASQDDLELQPEDIPLDILYEDEHIAVINKQPNLVVHPGAGNRTHTLVNALLYRYKTLPEGTEPGKPGIVHRLDKGTSGLLVVARTENAMQHLLNQFKNRETEKIYLALVKGKIPETGVFEKALGRHPTQRQKISSRTKKGREAKTEWRVLKYFGDLSWVEIHIYTGRTHQIRVHFAEGGYPVIGDSTYGRGTQILKEWIERPALHAWRLSFTHPKTGEKMKFEAPLPEDLKNLLHEVSGSL